MPKIYISRHSFVAATGTRPARPVTLAVAFVGSFLKPSSQSGAVWNVGSRVEDLPGIEQVVRIDCPLYLPEEIKACFAQLAPEERLLCQADAVFARNRAPERERLGEYLPLRGLHAAHLVGVPLVREECRGEVPVAEVPEGCNIQPVPCAGLLDEPDHPGELAPGNRGVLQDRGGSRGREGRERDSPRGCQALCFRGIGGEPD